MKKTLLSLFALLMAMSVNAQMITNAKARVYAYDLQQNDLTLTFKTNTKANTATVIFTAEGQDNVEVAASSTDGKNWTAVIEPSQEFAADVDYNWSVKVSADPVTEFAQINQDGVDFSFFRSYGIAIDNNPESDNFGRIYVANAYNATARSSKTTTAHAVTAGFYTFTPELIAENPNSSYACDIIYNENTNNGGVSGTATRRIALSDDGKLYVANNGSTYGGVYVVNPAENKFESSKLITTATSAVGVLGAGNETKLYTIAGDYSLNTYEIGTANTWNGDPTSTFKTKVINGYNTVVPVNDGLWVAQNRGIEDNTTLCFYDFEGNMKYDIHDDFEFVPTTNGTIAVDEKRGIIALSIAPLNASNKAESYVRILQYEIDSEGTISVEKVADYRLTIFGAKVDALAFDYAGNLYGVTSGNEVMAVYGIPTDENTCTTPAKKSLTVSFSEDQLTGVEEIGVENAPVEYYNLQGVKVENPSNGVFIKKQGGKAVKVVL